MHQPPTLHRVARIAICSRFLQTTSDWLVGTSIARSECMTQPHHEIAGIRSTWAISPRAAYEVGFTFEKQDNVNALTARGALQQIALRQRDAAYLEQRRVVFVSCDEGALEAPLAAKAVCREVGMSQTAMLDVLEVVEKLAQHIRQFSDAGTIAFSPLQGPLAGIEILAQDAGSDVDTLKTLLANTIYARTATGSHALADEFSISTSAHGNHVRFVKYA